MRGKLTMRMSSEREEPAWISLLETSACLLVHQAGNGCEMLASLSPALNTRRPINKLSLHPAGPEETRMNDNRIEGTEHQVKGAVKEGVGKLTGNTSKEVAGNLEKNAGKAQKNIGEAQDEIENLDD